MAFEIDLTQKSILVLMGVVFIGVVILLISIERNIAKRKLVTPTKTKEITVEEEIESLLRQKNLDESSLPKIRQLAINYFVQTYKIEPGISYEDLYQTFIEKEKPLAASFIKKMLEYEYAGVEIDSYKILALLTLLRKIIKEDKNNSNLENNNKKPKFKFLSKIFSFTKQKETAQPESQEKNSPYQIYKEEERTIPIFEEVRNLKPISIKPEVFTPPISRQNKKLSVTDKELNNLERIKQQIKRQSSLV